MVTFACVMGLIFGIGAFICAISKFASYVGQNLAPAVSNASLNTRFDIPKETRTRFNRGVNGAAMAGVAGAAAMTGAGAFYPMGWHENNHIPVSTGTDELSKAHQDALLTDPYLDPAQSHLIGNVYHDDLENSFGPDLVTDPEYSTITGNIFHDSSDDFSSSSMNVSSTFDSGSIFDSSSSFTSDSMFDSFSSSCDSGISFD